jgi:hypothetical protein
MTGATIAREWVMINNILRREFPPSEFNWTADDIDSLTTTLVLEMIRNQK